MSEPYNNFQSNSNQNSAKSESKFFGKRKCEQPPQNEYDKKRKTTAFVNRSVVATEKKENTKPESVKGKITKTALTKNTSTKNLNVLSNSNNISNTLCKTKFAEGLSKSLHSNIAKILEQENKLDKNLKNLNAISEDNKLKILNEFVKKNLELLELEYLMKDLESIKLANEEKAKTMRENNSQIIGNREALTFELEKSVTAIDALNSKKLDLQSRIIIKDEEIKNETQKHEMLTEKDKEVFDLRTNISFEIMTKDGEIKSIEKKQKLANQDLERVLSKKEEYYKNKLEAMSQLLILRPFYKKFCIIRTSKDSSPIVNNTNAIMINKNNNNITNPIRIAINKNRKILDIYNNNNNNDKSQIKFDYISSVIDNPYEESFYCKENALLNEEMATFFSSYLIKMNQFNDERDFNLLYLTDKLEVVKNEENQFKFVFNNNILTILQELINRISHYNDFTLMMKISSSNEEFQEVIKEFNYYPNSKFSLEKETEKNLLNYFMNFSKDKKLTSIYFCLKNKKNNSKMKIFVFDFNNLNLVNNLLSKFNEVNISKKKREKSSKKGKKALADIIYVLDEMDYNGGFFFSTIVDTTVEEFNNPNLKEILLNL